MSPEFPDAVSLSPEEQLEYLTAGLLVLVGAARQASSIGRVNGEEQLRAYAHLISQHVLRGGSDPEQTEALRLAHDTIAAQASTAIDWSRHVMPRETASAIVESYADRIREANREGVEVEGEYLKDLLAQTPDFERRAVLLEHRLEAAEYVQGFQDDLARELCRRLGRESNSSPTHDLRMAVDTVIGDRLASELRRDEMASFALSLLEHLRSLPTSDLPSDIEQVHHSVVASPRTRETEETARTHVQAWGDRLVAERAEAAERALREILESRAEVEAEVPLSLLERAGVRPWSAMSGLQRGIWIGTAIGLIGSGAGQLVAAALV